MIGVDVVDIARAAMPTVADLSIFPAVLIVRPDEIFAWSRQRPLVERLTANQRAEHLALDDADSAATGYTCQISAILLDLI